MTKEKVRGFEVVADKFKMSGYDVPIPVKATRNSAGYDFVVPIDVDIPPQTMAIFSTDIKAYMQPDEVLLMFPRSSTGIRHNLEISNTVVVGDADFYENEYNDGNYKIALWNRSPAWVFVKHDTVPELVDLTERNTVHLKAGDRVVQGIFFKTLPADGGASDAVRTGGIGSTGR